MRERSGIPTHPIVGALSPSRAGDFRTCPLLYRFRAIDRIPERPGHAAARGSLVHEVLDRLFDLPAAGRTPEAAADGLPAALDRLLSDEPEVAFAFVPDARWPDETPPEIPEQARQAVFAQARSLLTTYFGMEDPRVVEPKQREALLEATLDQGLVLRGYVDRIDDDADGLRVVDYKTGSSPSPMWEQSAIFQLRFYALILRLTSGRTPRRLQLFYLGNGEVLHYEPTDEDLQRFDRTVRAMWATILRCADTGDWRPRESAFCRFCPHQSLCPAKGGTPPALPLRVVPSADTVEG